MNKRGSHLYEAFTNGPTNQPGPLTDMLKEIFRAALLLASIALIAIGAYCWLIGDQPASKFLVATGVWFELHLFSALQEGSIR